MHGYLIYNKTINNLFQYIYGSNHLIYIINSHYYRGGIYTPAAAFGDTNIVQKMEATGKIKFTIEQL